MLFIARFKSGKYGRFYGAIDPDEDYKCHV